MPIGSDKGFFVKPGFNPLAEQTTVSASDFFSWGVNAYGQLGLGNTTNYSSPVQVGITEWLTFSAGYNWAGAIKSNNTLWMMGQNNLNQLGLGAADTTNRSSPTQVGALTDWEKLAVGAKSGLAIKTDGALWAWGSNVFGETGQPTVSRTASPMQVGALTTWLTIAAGFYTSYAIKTDGTLWSWGYNAQGRLGTNNTTTYSSPVQVGALTTWLDITAGYGWAVATKTDGTLWAWGKGIHGALGQGNVNDYSSPVQIGALTTWLKVASGAYHVLAINTTGELYAWGSNDFGGLGQGNTTSTSSPVQVGALTTWDKISGGPNSSSYAIKTDGTFWSWGYNHEGQLGVGNQTNYSSPVQVGALTSWSFLGKRSQSYGSFALQF